MSFFTFNYCLKWLLYNVLCSSELQRILQLWTISSIVTDWSQACYSLEEWYYLIGKNFSSTETLGVQHDLGNQLTVWFCHRQATEQLLQIVRQIRSACIARIHGDEDSHVRAHFDLFVQQLTGNGCCSWKESAFNYTSGRSTTQRTEVIHYFILISYSNKLHKIFKFWHKVASSLHYLEEM